MIRIGAGIRLELGGDTPLNYRYSRHLGRVTENTPLRSFPGTFPCRVASSGTALSVHSGGADTAAVLAAQVAILKKQF